MAAYPVFHESLRDGLQCHRPQVFHLHVYETAN